MFLDHLSDFVYRKYVILNAVFFCPVIDVDDVFVSINVFLFLSVQSYLSATQSIPLSESCYEQRSSDFFLYVSSCVLGLSVVLVLHPYVWSEKASFVCLLVLLFVSSRVMTSGRVIMRGVCPENQSRVPSNRFLVESMLSSFIDLRKNHINIYSYR